MQEQNVIGPTLQPGCHPSKGAVLPDLFAIANAPGIRAIGAEGCLAALPMVLYLICLTRQTSVKHRLVGRQLYTLPPRPGVLA